MTSTRRDHGRVRQGAHRVRASDRFVPGAQAHPRRHQLLGRGEHRRRVGRGRRGRRRPPDRVGDREHRQGVRRRRRHRSSRSSASRCTAASASPGSTTCTSTCGGSPPTACSTATPTGTASASAGSTGSERNGMTATTTDETISVDDFRAKAREWLAANCERKTAEADRRRRLAARPCTSSPRSRSTPSGRSRSGSTRRASRASRGRRSSAARAFTGAHERAFIGGGRRRTCCPNFGIAGGTTFGVCAQVMLAHASDDFKRRHLPRILAGDELWCQFFSEPVAGSDLAGRADARDARRRLVGPQRRQGVELVGAPRRLRPVPHPHQLERAQAPRAHLVRRAGRRRRASRCG